MYHVSVQSSEKKKKNRKLFAHANTPNQMDAPTDFDFEGKVPDEILCQLFSYMKDEYWVWYNVCLVCRRWNRVCHDAVYNIGGCDGRALSYYARKGDAGAVKRLLYTHGVDPLLSGSRPIAEALMNQHHEILDALIEHPRIAPLWESIQMDWTIPWKARTRHLIQIINEMASTQDTTVPPTEKRKAEEHAPVPPDSNEESVCLVFGLKPSSECAPDSDGGPVGSSVHVDSIRRPNHGELARCVHGYSRARSGLHARRDSVSELWVDSIERLKKQRIGMGVV